MVEIGSLDHASVKHLFAEVLAGSRESGDGRLYQVGDVSTSEGSAHLGRDPDGACHVLLPIGAREPLDADRSSDGVHFAAVTWMIDGDLVRCADLHCTDREFENEFFLLAVMVLNEVRTGTAPITACRRVLDRFRALLRQRREAGIDRTRTAGLVAELLWMQKVAEIDPGAALASWQGDSGGTQDFVNGARSVEVKATLSRDLLTVSISSLDQLEVPGDGELHLYVVRLDHRPGGTGETVPGLIDSLSRAGVPKAALLDRLAGSELYNYLEIDRDRYEKEAFTVVDEYLFRVGPGFPRLTRDQLRDDVSTRVLGIGYQIDLVDLDEHRVDPGAYPSVAAHLAGGDGPA